MSLDINKIKEQIEHGNTSLGIELGSTRIKAVLIGEDHTPIASGSHDWENRYVDHIWTYTLEDIWTGIRDCYGKMAEDVKETCGITPVSYTHLDVYKRQAHSRTQRRREPTASGHHAGP